VVAGSASRDVDRTDARGWRLGGTAPYVALGLARLGLRVGLLLGADGEAGRAHELDLFRTAAVDLALVPLAEGPVFENRETASGRRQVCLSVGDALDPAAVPGRWAATRVLALAPVAGELGPGWAAAIPDATLVALALQGTLRVLSPGRPTAHRPLRADALTRRADLLMVGRDDIMSQVADPADIPADTPAATGDPLERLLTRPGQRMVVTAGAAGGLLLRRRQDGRLAVRRYPPVPAAAVVDLTGAGDAFLAGWIAAAMVLGASADARALRVAAGTASLKVEGYGLAGLPTLAALRHRLRRAAPA
jgi:sugar/nucleoside kinase (ribokinase family)